MRAYWFRRRLRGKACQVTPPPVGPAVEGLGPGVKTFKWTKSSTVDSKHEPSTAPDGSVPPDQQTASIKTTFLGSLSSTSGRLLLWLLLMWNFNDLSLKRGIYQREFENTTTIVIILLSRLDWTGECWDWIHFGMYLLVQCCAFGMYVWYDMNRGNIARL